MLQVQKDEFNSNIFNLNMGNILNFNMKEIENIEADAKKLDFQHLSVKIRSSDKIVLNEFLKNDFLLVDTLIRYQFNFKKNLLSRVEHICKIRSLNEQDIPVLIEMAKNSFKIDRFHSDPNLENKKCDEYYKKWIQNSCKGLSDIVLVAEFNQKVVGFTTGKFNKETNEAVLVLSAVSDKYRGIGIYTSMIYEGVKWAENQGAVNLVVGTQLDNIAVQKAWIKLGFTVLDSEYVLHKSIK